MYWPDKHLYQWATHLKEGGIGIAPAEGQYGYVADPFNPQALEALINIKKRSPKKGLIVLAADKSELKHICPPLSLKEKEAIKKYWWGAIPPTTLILPAKETLSTAALTGGRQTIAIRRPFVPYMQTYLAAWKTLSGHGLLVSTSCNLSGEAPAISAQTLPENQEGIVNLTLKGDLSGEPSRIFDVNHNKFLR